MTNTTTSTSITLTSIEEKLDALLRLEQMNANNILALYRRTTALAHMVEAVAEGREPRLPQTIRAEIDASLNADAFEQLARQDLPEFLRRYGQGVLDVLQKQGVTAITRIGELAPLKSEHGVH